MAEINVEDALSGLGLTKPEIAVYLASLASGARPAGIIAKKAGLKRGHTYNVLGSLLEKGIVQEFVRNGTRNFTTSSPEELVSLLESKAQALVHQKEKLLQVIPELQNLAHARGIQSKVRFFQGVEGVKEAFEDTLRVPKETIYALVDLQFSATLNDELRSWMVNYTSRRTAKDIWYLGMIKKSDVADEALRTRKSNRRKVKMLSDIDLPVEINVYGPKVAILSTHEEMVAVVIENESLATTLRRLHQAVWNFLPDYK